MLEKVKKVFEGTLDTCLGFVTKILKIIENCLDAIVKVASNPKQVIWVLIGLDLVLNNAYYTTTVVNAVMSLLDKTVESLVKGGMPLLLAAVFVYLIVKKK